MNACFIKSESFVTLNVTSVVIFGNRTVTLSHVSGKLSLQYFKNFTADYIPNKYVDKQADFCNNIGVCVSKTVLFGIDYNNKFPQYNRGGRTNRLSFHKQYIKGLDIASTK